jgi:hypothetical protein
MKYTTVFFPAMVAAAVFKGKPGNGRGSGAARASSVAPAGASSVAPAGASSVAPAGTSSPAAGQGSKNAGGGECSFLFEAC